MIVMPTQSPGLFWERVVNESCFVAIFCMAIMMFEFSSAYRPMIRKQQELVSSSINLNISLICIKMLSVVFSTRQFHNTSKIIFQAVDRIGIGLVDVDVKSSDDVLTGDTAARMTCIDDDATSTSSSFQFARRLVRSSVTTADGPTTSFHARPVTWKTDRCPTDSVQQTTFTIDTTQLTARQSRCNNQHYIISLQKYA